jgi:tyrosyl-tRNA synthetase
MAPSLALLVRRGSICPSCLLPCAKGLAPVQRRHISEGFRKKTAEAEKEWQEWAQEIKDGKRRNLWDMLEERGYVKDTAGYAALLP